MENIYENFLANNITLRQSEEVVKVLADAFARDPVISWLSHDSSYPRHFFENFLPLFTPYNQIYLAENAVAVGLPPGTKMQVSMSLTFRGLRKFGLGSVMRLRSLLKVMDQNHPTQQHYYLFAIGVSAESQAHGMGSALLTHFLKRCDREGMPVYLENSNAKNLHFYERHGFQVLSRLDLSSNGPWLWPMWRDPVISSCLK